MIKVERQDHVAIVTLDRPDARNAINRALEEALFRALEEIDRDSAIRVGVIAAIGPVFSSGADLKEISASGNPRADNPTRESIVSRSHVKPLIAAVDGPALGGGAELVLSCDLVVASTAAKFALPEVRWGLLASGGGVFRLSRLVPKRVALQLLLTGASISAQRGYELGLVNEVTDPGGALAGALALAKRIAENGPLAVQLTRQLVEETAFLDEREAWVRSRRVVAENFESQDAREGPRAFAEKRKPNWTGR
jgi:enoyl-CoA hydratase